jgi:hypothetical protein
MQVDVICSEIQQSLWELGGRRPQIRLKLLVSGSAVRLVRKGRVERQSRRAFRSKRVLRTLTAIGFDISHQAPSNFALHPRGSWLCPYPSFLKARFFFLSSRITSEHRPRDIRIRAFLYLHPIPLHPRGSYFQLE